MPETSVQNQNDTRRDKRVFHDGWAFYLYFLSYIIIITIFFVNIGDTSKIETIFADLNKNNFLLLNAGLFFMAALIFLICCYFIPKVLLWIVVLSVPSITALTLIKAPNVQALSLVFGVISLIWVLIFAFLILRHINYISKMLSAAAGILIRTFPVLVLVLAISTTFMILQLLPMIIDSKDNQILQRLKWGNVLLQFWTIEIFAYFNMVLISSISYNILTSNSCCLSKSLSNTFYALGSISYAALIMALISTLRMFVNEQRNGDRSRRSIFSTILLAITGFILDALSAIAEFANSLSMPYLAVFGTNYEDSVVKSFGLISSSGMGPILSLGVMNWITGIFLIPVIIVILSLNIVVFKIEDAKSLEHSQIAVFIFFSYLLYLIFDALRTVMLTINFKVIDNEDDVKKYDSTIIDAIKEENKLLN